MDDVFDGHGVVGHFGHGGQLGLDLELTGAPHFRVVVLDGDARLLHAQAHLAAALIGAVQGLGDVVVSLPGHNESFAVPAAVPVGLLCVQCHGDGFGSCLPGHAVKEIELELRQDEHGVRDAGAAHIRLRRPDDVPGVLGQGAVLGVVDDHGAAGHGQGGHLAEGVGAGGVRVGDEHHVALFHRGIAVVGGIEADALGHGGFGKVLGGDGHMAVLPIDVHHFEVHHLYALLTDEPDHLVRGLCHFKYLLIFTLDPASDGSLLLLRE